MTARRRLLLIALCDEIAPFLALFTLYFDDIGITLTQVSAVFVLWALMGVALELPTGIAADRFDRRRVLAASVLMRGAGIAVWLLWPSFAGVLVGAGLWAVHTAATSGAWEALVHDQLAAEAAEADYPVVMARLGQAQQLGVVLGTQLAGVLLWAGVSLTGLAALTVALQLGVMLALLGLPEARVSDWTGEPLSHWLRQVQEGFWLSVGSPSVRRWLVLGALLEGVFVVDEYVPLLGRLRDASDAQVSALVMGVYLGTAVGGELAARRPNLEPRALAGVLALGGVSLAVALWGQAWWALAFVGVAYGAMNATWILTEAAFQRAVHDSVRATVGSVRALAATGISALLFVGVGMAGPDPSMALTAVLPALAVVMVLLARA